MFSFLWRGWKTEWQYWISSHWVRKWRILSQFRHKVYFFILFLVLGMLLASLTLRKWKSTALGIWLMDFLKDCPAPARVLFLNASFFFPIFTTSYCVFMLFNNSCSSEIFRNFCIAGNMPGAIDQLLAFSLILSRSTFNTALFLFFCLLFYKKLFFGGEGRWDVTGNHINGPFQHGISFLLQILLNRV